jgi:hypothetical protein
MKDRFGVDFNQVSQAVLPPNTYRLSDVAHRIEKVAYDMVRFRDNQDTEQLWKIKETADGPVIVALYGDDGQMTAQSKLDWDAVPDKKAMHIFYKGEPLVSFSSADLGIPVEEFQTVRRWLPKKLASDADLQKALFSKISVGSRVAIAKRFPELTKVAQQFPSIPDGTQGATDTMVRPEDASNKAEALAHEVLQKCQQQGVAKQEVIEALNALNNV